MTNLLPPLVHTMAIVRTAPPQLVLSRWHTEASPGGHPYDVADKQDIISLSTATIEAATVALDRLGYHAGEWYEGDGRPVVASCAAHKRGIR